MPAPQRQVRRLRLGAASVDAARGLLPRLEDALRCASLPDTGAEWLLVRRLALGPLATTASAQAISLLVEQRLRDVAPHWRDGAADDAVAAAHVCFASRLQAHEALAMRVLRGQPCRAWYWPLVAPGFAADAPAAQNLAAIERAVAAGPQGPPALAAWRATLRAQAAPAAAASVARPTTGEPAGALSPGPSTATPDGDPVAAPTAPNAGGFAQALPQPASPVTAPTGPALPAMQAAPVPTRHPARPHADVVPAARAGSSARAEPQADRPTGHASDIANAATACPPPAAAPTAATGLPTHAQAAVEPTARHPGAPIADAARPAAAGSASAPDADALAPLSMPVPPATAGTSFHPPPLHERDGTASWHAPMTAATQPVHVAHRDVAPPGDAAPVATLAHAHAAGLETAHAGLLFLLPVLARLGLPEWAQTQGGDTRAWTNAVLQAALQRLQAGPDEPLLGLLQGRAPAAAGAAPALWVAPALAPPRGRPQGTLAAVWCDAATAPAQAAVWLHACRRWLRRGPRIGLASLVRRPGRVVWSPTHIDVGFDLSWADLRVRRHGLDIDPGWLHWFGRVVAFHYERPR